jgi:hypothetical protein
MIGIVDFGDEDVVVEVKHALIISCINSGTFNGN